MSEENRKILLNESKGEEQKKLWGKRGKERGEEN